MKRVYWLVPFLCVTAFAAYYHRWNQQLDMSYHGPGIPFDPFSPYAVRDGPREAEADIARGTPQLLTYGLPGVPMSEFREVLQRDYGVDERAIAGCVVSESLVKYAHDYNATIERHLKAKYGAEFMDVAARKAEALYAQRHPPTDEPVAK